MTQQGFLRLSTNPRVLGDEVLTMDSAWQTYDALLADDRISYVEEPPDVESAWRRFTLVESYSHKIWNDAYLAAFAQCLGAQLVTFDRGFSRYASLNALILA